MEHAHKDRSSRRRPRARPVAEPAEVLGAWRRFDPPSPTVRIDGEIVRRPPLWVSDAGYTVAAVDIRHHELGLAVWRPTPGGLVRVAPGLMIARIEDGRALADLDAAQRRPLRGLPIRLAAIAVTLGAPLVTRTPLGDYVGLLELARPGEVRLLRQLLALAEEVRRAH